MADLLAQGHPAFVHLPLGLVAILPLLLVLAARREGWGRPALLVAGLAWVGGLLALGSGLLWARARHLLPAGGFRPPEGASFGPALEAHMVAALVGALLGAAFLARSLRRGGRPGLLDGALALAWVLAWGWAGHRGGRMVHGAPPTQAAPQAEGDPEAELPIRALDFASLEPLSPGPRRSGPHGNRWARTWASPAGAEALRKGRGLPPGGLAVLVTAQGADGWDPGPLYVRERREDGSPVFALYWVNIPIAERSRYEGADSIYWRGTDPHLAACAGCHREH